MAHLQGLPYDIREAFVRGRFAEDNVFQNAEVEAWLKEQRGAETPDRRWTVYRKRLHALYEVTEGREYELITTGATGGSFPVMPQGEVDQGDEGIFQRWLENMRELFLLIKGGNHRFYTGSQIGVAVTYTRRGQPQCLALYATELRMANELSLYGGLHPRMAQDILLTEWQEHRAKWQTARELLCGLLQEAIQLVRKGAEAEWDDSPGVSQDGAHIYPARWVVLYDRSEQPTKMLIYEGARFRHTKLRCDDIFPRRMFTINDPWAEVSTSLLANTLFHRVQVDRRRFDPLPTEEEREVRVLLGDKPELIIVQQWGPAPSGRGYWYDQPGRILFAPIENSYDGYPEGGIPVVR